MEGGFLCPLHEFTSSLRQNPLSTRQNSLLHSPSLESSSLLYGYCKDCLSLVIKDYNTHTLSGIRKRRLKESSSQTTSSKKYSFSSSGKVTTLPPSQGSGDRSDQTETHSPRVSLLRSYTIEFLNAIQPLAFSLEFPGVSRQFGAIFVLQLFSSKRTYILCV